MSLSRRQFLNLSTLAGASLALSACTADAPAIQQELNEGPAKSPEEALQRLIEGNARFVQNKTIDPNQSATRRVGIANSQAPFAQILGCVDSRVPPELVFDRGLGDLFVIRTAAQVIDDAVLGSLEFGVAELAIPLLVVMGHERCGAVKAAIESIEQNHTAPGSIAALVEAIRPAVEETAGTTGDHLDLAVRANIENVVERLSTSAILSAALASGKLRIIGARYDLDSGIVELMQ
jgi:carbonic anhydrase